MGGVNEWIEDWNERKFSDPEYVEQLKRNAVANGDAVELLGAFLIEAVEGNLKYIIAETDWEPGDLNTGAAKTWAWVIAETYIRYMVGKRLRQAKNN